MAERIDVRRVQSIKFVYNPIGEFDFYIYHRIRKIGIAGNKPNYADIFPG